ncbi:hypothetical protein FB451DRAFT_1569729 [Mycena latifolia]|nr:hypothetical protein FB451DRAFT_1569729 [Mycena latifolia]
MVLAPKGSVIKKATIALYKEEIEALYDTIEASGNAASDIEPPSSWASQDLEAWLTKHVSLLAERDIHGDHDLFNQGFDSLKATFLRHRIVGALKNSEDEAAEAAAHRIPPNFVYAHPFIKQLAIAIIKLPASDEAIGTGLDPGHKAAIEEMIVKYCEGFDESFLVLTGPTGGLGCHLLEILLRLSSVERVYAFNRKGRASVPDRQKDAFVDRALDVELLSSKKLVYLEGDMSKADLGLSAKVYTTLRNTITVIVHNAWTLDFNKLLSSFEPHIKGTRNLIDLARQSPNIVHFLFTSSVASAQGWDLELGPFPEELQLDADAEWILAASSLEATSFRIGQISGAATNGAWSTTDWVPAIVKFSIAVGGFPSNPSVVVAWIPPETVARMIVDAALCAEHPPFAINLHPLIPFAEWIRQLETRSARATAEDIENIPGIKLLDFFTSVEAGQWSTEFSTVKAQALSNAMQSVMPLWAQDAERGVEVMH